MNAAVTVHKMTVWKLFHHSSIAHVVSVCAICVMQVCLEFFLLFCFKIPAIANLVFCVLDTAIHLFFFLMLPLKMVCICQQVACNTALFSKMHINVTFVFAFVSISHSAQIVVVVSFSLAFVQI